MSDSQKLAREWTERFSESRCGRVSEGITITAFICLRIWRCRGVTGCGKGVQLLYFGDTHVRIDLQGHRLFGLCLLSFAGGIKSCQLGKKRAVRKELSPAMNLMKTHIMNAG